MQQTNTQNLVKLSDAGDLRVAEGNEDIRGWEVRGSDGDKVGKVKDLLVDPTQFKPGPAPSDAAAASPEATP